jgi:hypothetical protein
MEFAKSIFSAVLTVSLIAYAFDCAPVATAQQAMQCCKSMRCMSHHQHGQDCCKTMPSTHDVVGQPSSANHSFAPAVCGLVEPFGASPSVTTSARLIADQSHAPPVFSQPTVLPLRI